MANTRVMILEGPNGQSFFLKETLLAEKLAGEVDLVSQADQAIDMIHHSVYDLVVINLTEAWEQGMKLGFWLSQKPSCCPTILIISAELDRPLPSNESFIVLSEPLSLRSFSASVRTVLQPSAENDPPNVQSFSNSQLPGLPSWSGEPLHQEYLGYWSLYAQAL